MSEINYKKEVCTCIKQVRKDIIEANEKLYGDNICSIYLMEESSEVIKELTKIIRNKGNWDKLAEEVSDLYYTLSMVTQKYNITEEEINKNILQKEIYAMKALNI